MIVPRYLAINPYLRLLIIVHVILSTKLHTLRKLHPEFNANKQRNMNEAYS